MIESMGQMGLEAYVYPGQARKTGAGYADPEALASGRDVNDPPQGPMDQYIPSEEREDSGLYSRDSLLNNGASLGEVTVKVAEDEDHAGPNAYDEQDVTQGHEPNELDEGDKDLVERLEKRDVEVKQHEQAHAAAAGEYAEGAPHYSYQMGPNGKMYAIGGSLAVDVGKEASSAETMRKARMLQGSAMGVADPSAADAMVSMEAGTLMAEGFLIQA